MAGSELQEHHQAVGNYRGMSCKDLDTLILAQIDSDTSAVWTFGKIYTTEIAQAAQAEAGFDNWRAVDRRLQAMRKRGVLAYNRRDGWRRVNAPENPADAEIARLSGENAVLRDMRRNAAAVCSDDRQEHVAWCRYIMRHGNPTRIVLCDSDADGAFQVFRRRHGGACLADESARSVCDGTYHDKIDAVISLCDTIREIYALVGEDQTISKIVNDALRRHEI